MPPTQLLERLAKGEKTKMSVKEMKELSKKNFYKLPEVLKRKEEEQIKQDKLNALKMRKEKVKMMDQKLR